MLAAALWPLCVLGGGAARAGALADALDRPASPAGLASRPVLLRVARAGDRLVAVGERGLVLCSDDDGHQWRQAAVPVSVTLTGVCFVDARRGWAIGHAGVVLHTADGGSTWARQFDGRRLPDGAGSPLLALLMLDAERGWAVGAHGLTLVTHDGGRQWAPPPQAWPNPRGMHLYALARQDDALFVAGEQGLFMRLPLDAATLGPAGPASVLSAPYRGSFFAMAALPDGGLLLGGLRGTVLRRSALGEFAPIDSGTTQAIVSCTVLDAQRLALVDQAGRVLLGGASAGFRALPADAARRWVAVAAARDGALVGAGTTGVGRLPGSPGGRA